MSRRVFESRLIYVYSIDDTTHRYVDENGVSQLTLKIGEHRFNVESELGMESYPPSEKLAEYARQRINQQTGTAAIPYKLEYAELSAYTKEGEPNWIDSDDVVHKILLNSGYKRHDFGLEHTDPQEWFDVSLEIAKKAIKAAKNEQNSLDPSDHRVEKHETFDKFPFREEQLRAINDTKSVFNTQNKMLWNAKMRFGKTSCALQVVKELNKVNRTLIITHRPDVRNDWYEDFRKLSFPDNYWFGAKKRTGDKDFKFKTFKVIEEAAQKGEVSYIYFASLQDIRGSFRKRGQNNYETSDLKKNKEIFDTKWDMLIVDEAHEGTTTSLGNLCIKEIQRRNPKMKTLYLSGTPFNIQNEFSPKQIFTWDYNMEQNVREHWHELHPDKKNPYEDLPKVIFNTYNLGNVYSQYSPKKDEDYFSFTEFFRVSTGQDKDAGIPEGKFVHEEDVWGFLKMLHTPDIENNYPYATEADMYATSHSFWLLDRVSSVKALRELLAKDEVLKQYHVIDVAGDVDIDYETEDASEKEEKETQAREKVKKGVSKYPKTITLSCGRLTTGVSIPEWSAIFMLGGGYHTKAASYLQAAFRAQTPTPKNILPKKRECYVYDFAPDRTIDVIYEMAEKSVRASHGNNIARNDFTKLLREKLKDTLHFMPVIARDGGSMEEYGMERFLVQVNRIAGERMYRKGGLDRSIYQDLSNPTPKQLDALFRIASKAKNNKKSSGGNKGSSSATGVRTAAAGLTGEDNPTGTTTTATTTGNEQNTNPGNKDKTKTREQQILDVLNPITKRFPMMIFGSDLDDENITIESFIKMFEHDKESWDAFMPDYLTIDDFKEICGLWKDNGLLVLAKMIKEKARHADELPITERVKEMADIISTFRFPDRETILTPWRVVNMHMSDTLGGYDYFDEKHTEGNILAEPRFTDPNCVANKVYSPRCKVLEINSKSGLYPLYVAYSMYRERIYGRNHLTIEEQRMEWDSVLANNLYVICMTPMAKKITYRVLAGFRNVNTNLAYIDGMIDMIKDNKQKEKLVDKIKTSSTYRGRKRSKINFDAIVGNPPYQQSDGGNAASAMPIYQLFVQLAKKLDSGYLSMIIPARWYAGGRGLDDFRQEMLSDKHILNLVDYPDSRDCFYNVNIAGGICYFLRNKNKQGDCNIVNITSKETTTSVRKLNQYSVFIRANKAIGIIDKVMSNEFESLSKEVCSSNPFGFRTYIKGEKKPFEDSVLLHTSNGFGYVSRKDITRNQEAVETFNVILSRAISGGNKPGSDGKYLIIPSTMRVIKPGEICAETYQCIGHFNDEKEATNLKIYLSTNFVRFLMFQAITGIMVTRESFQFVPLQDFSHPWTDEMLYEKYGLTDDEIAYIESLIKPMETTTTDDAKKVEIHYHVNNVDHLTLAGQTSVDGDIVENGGMKIVK